jgi:hypothetical protein
MTEPTSPPPSSTTPTGTQRYPLPIPAPATSDDLAAREAWKVLAKASLRQHVDWILNGIWWLMRNSPPILPPIPPIVQRVAKAQLAEEPIP